MSVYYLRTPRTQSSLGGSWVKVSAKFCETEFSEIVYLSDLVSKVHLSMKSIEVNKGPDLRWRKGCFYSEISSTLFSSCVVTSPMWVQSHLVTSLNKMTRHNSQQDKWHNVDFNIFTGFLLVKIKQTWDQTSVLITIRACRIFHPVCKSHFCKEEIILRVQHFHRVSPWCLESGGRSNTHISEISHDRGSGAKARWHASKPGPGRVWGLMPIKTLLWPIIGRVWVIWHPWHYWHHTHATTSHSQQPLITRSCRKIHAISRHRTLALLTMKLITRPMILPESWTEPVPVTKKLLEWHEKCFPIHNINCSTTALATQTRQQLLLVIVFGEK